MTFSFGFEEFVKARRGILLAAKKEAPRVSKP